MSKLTMAAVALSLLVMTPFAARQAAPPADALDGVDVVVLLQQGKEVFGKSAFHSVHGGFNYLFSSAETKAQFDKAPEKYAIQLGGLCARMGGTVTGNPSDYAVHDGRIYIFGSDECRKLFIATPGKYLPRPAAPMTTDSEAVAKGRQLLDEAARAHGGQKLDAITSYVETWTVTQQRQTGAVTVPNKNVWRFPAEARNERTIPLASGPMTIVTALTSAGAWTAAGRDSSVPRPAVMPAIERVLWRQLVPLLRTRRDPNVKVAALGSTSVDGVPLERVRLARGGVDVTLNIDASSHRVHSMAYTDRKNDGEVGEITIVFSDLKPIDGVLVPFGQTATFNGAPDAPLTRRLESAVVNAPLDPQLFVRPAGAEK